MELISEIFTRRILDIFLDLREKRMVIQTTRGRIRSMAMASLKSIYTSTAMIPRRVNISFITKVITVVNISCMFWISFVTLVARRATVFSEKKAMGSPWICL